MICRERGRREAALPAAAERPGESAGPEHLPKTKGNEKMNDRANQLLRICLALTSERDREKFLCMVLDAAMKVAHCDAGTLYLLENDALTFVRMVTISQNMRRGCGGDPITLPPVPMKSQYVCAKAAMDGIMVNIPNVREVKGFDFSGALEYDRITGYRTQSMLVMPMTDIKGRVIGVMQLINAMDGDNVVPFSKDIEQLIGAVSSQAAACILNMQYARQINALLESLVDTMTKAIDDRTPYNASHSCNMAKYAERFLDWAETKVPGWSWSNEHRQAFLLSVKLHDIGKIVTPLAVMDKSDRLAEKMERIEERFRRMDLLDRIAFLEGNMTEAEYTGSVRERKDDLTRIREMNIKEQLSEKECEWARQTGARTFRNEEGKEEPWLTKEEIACLQVRRGTLTDPERQTMNNHVAETSRILAEVQFPSEYQEVPFWASAHHELLDGTGYPNHLSQKDLPPEVRLLTILDIFDSLVASDRPYKKAKSAEEAFRILHQMAAAGKLDEEMLNMFEASRAWQGESHRSYDDGSRQESGR